MVEKEIEKAIKETLVIENKQSIGIAIEKIMSLFKCGSKQMLCECGREASLTKYCSICDNDS